jgi:uncharacterized protein YdbL (DUF1318 family)
MQTMTAEQAAEWGKTLDFPTVWAMITKLGESQQEGYKQLKEMSAATDARIKEMFTATDAQIEKLGQRVNATTESVHEMARKVDEVTAQLGGVGNTLGGIIEDMFLPNICSKFDAFGYEFTKTSRNMVFRDAKRQKIAEVDAFLENGDYVMAVEVKSRLEVKYVNQHLERLMKIREYMNEHNDFRKILGAIAAGYVPEKERMYAEGKGLFVLMQDADDYIVCETPNDEYFHKGE